MKRRELSDTSFLTVHLVSSLDEGGIQRVVVDLTEELSRVSGQMIAVKRNRPDAFAVSPRVQVRRLSSRKTVGALTAFLRFRRLLLSVRPAVIVGHGNRNAPVAILAGMSTGIPCVVTEHSVAEDLRSRVYRMLRCILYPLSARVLVLATDQLREYPFSRVRLMPNPVRLPGIPSRSAAGDAIRIAFVGRFHPVKRIPLLLRAVSLASREIPVELELVGGGPEEGYMKAEVERLGLNQCVRFHGWIPDPENVLASCHLLAMTSQYEGFPMALVEAMALGVVPVVFDVPGGLRDIVTHEETGFLLPDGDVAAFARCIVLLHGNGDLRSRISEAARSETERFRSDAIARRWLRMLERLT